MIDNKRLQTWELFNCQYNKLNFLILTWSSDETHQQLDQDNVIGLRELEAIHSDVFVQAGYPGDNARSQLLQSDGPAQV